MGFSLATDVAEWLVKQGVPFRQAHEITGELVKFCEQQVLQLHELSDAQLAQVSVSLKPEVRQVMSVTQAIASREGLAGTALPRVLDQLLSLRKISPRKKN